jgi:hypothetical protein
MFIDRHQSKSWQKRLIEDARATGQLHQLRWYVEMDIPAASRRGPDHRIQCASHPPGYVPVIPLDAQGADDYAHLLLELFRSANPDSTFRLMLTDVPMLEECRIAYYTYGEDPAPAGIDIICTACGLVGRGQPGQRLGCSRGCLAQQE